MSETTRIFIELVVELIPLLWIVGALAAMVACSLALILLAERLMPNVGDTGQKLAIAVCVILGAGTGFLVTTWVVAALIAWLNTL